MRRFKHLNTLNLHGNPFCKHQDYHAYTIAHLPSLVYLDYRLIDNIKREAAIERYRDSIDELTHDEAVLQHKIEEEEEKQSQSIGYKVQYFFLPGFFLFLYRDFYSCLFFIRKHMLKILMVLPCLAVCLLKIWKQRN